MSIPYHHIIKLSNNEAIRIMLKAHALVLRFPDDSENIDEAKGGLCVCTNKDYDFSSLHVKARNQTRRALEQCKIERIDFSDLATIGHELNVQTFTRQGRAPQSFPIEKWKKYCQVSESNSDFEAWGSFIDGKLAAFCVCALIDDCYNILHQSSATKYLSYYPNNALAFLVTQQAFRRPEVSFVSYGLKSMESTDGLDHFKERMGYHIRPHMDKIIINPLLKLPLILGGAKFISYMHRRNPESDFWRKGKRTLDLLCS
jgi:hypothetical protein